MTGRIFFFAAAGLLMIACQQKTAPEIERASEAEAASAELPQGATSPAPAVEPIKEPAVQRRNTESVDARIVKVTLSDRGDPERELIGASKAVFQPSDTVYASVETDGTSREYVIYARWFDTQGEVLSEYGIGIDQPGKQRRILSLSKPDGWSAGRHVLELVVNDGSKQSVDFEVVSP